MRVVRSQIRFFYLSGYLLPRLRRADGIFARHKIVAPFRFRRYIQGGGEAERLSFFTPPLLEVPDNQISPSKASARSVSPVRSAISDTVKLVAFHALVQMKSVHDLF